MTTRYDVPLRRSVWLLALLVLTTGCSITQEVKPVTPAQLASKEICVRENVDVRPGFLEAYKGALENKGFSVRVLEPTTGVTACPLLSTYSANWRWDFTLYMAYAEMRVYRDGNEIGKAVYDSTVGGLNMNKFIKADEKVRELVDQLFPS
jgi:hypothetical protein